MHGRYSSIDVFRHVGLLGLIWLVQATVAYAAGTQATQNVRDLLPETWEWSIDTQGPVCGVYAISRATEILGDFVPPGTFWNSRVVGHSDGSTPDALVAALRKHGFKAVVRTKLSLIDLAVLPGPVVANVRKSTSDLSYNHWVCVQNNDTGVLVYDGPNDPILVSSAEFLARWSGVGIPVSKTQHLFVLSGLARFWSICFLLVLVSVPLFLLPHQLLGIRWIEFFLITGTSVFSMVIGGLVIGTWSGYEAGWGQIAAPYQFIELREVGLAEIEKASERQDCLLVDARTERSFDMGSIANAVNIPVYASDRDIREFTANLPRSVPIVVFCQSAKCGYDDRVAKKLVLAGFPMVRISQPGYAEYRASKEQQVALDQRE